ncbi:hypothetical protein NLG97_g443 [Lecanicillium saksenae]|uniref:Uncharacterized protein n=1 Tax=Lecanicillium saksenae TaxID=468837 RepID=A0ACC1R965_9HYPO|nr:hypothetical protein NLG97_g443 [Lecanicillium saksenae]
MSSLALEVAAHAAKVGETASIKAVYRHNDIHLGRHMARAYQKFGIPVPEDVLAATKFETDDSSIKKTHGIVASRPDEFDTEYLSLVDIGTPPQRVNLLFDSGSSDLWVFSSELPQDQVDGQRLFNPAKSRTASLLEGLTWHAEYADLSDAQGVVYNDVVTVGNLTVQNQAVEVARKVSQDFVSDPESSGVMGLSFGYGNNVEPTQQNTWFNNILPNLTQGLFTANLHYKADGNYNFGYIDPDEHIGEMVYTPVDDTYGSWMFNVSGYKIGNKSFQPQTLFSLADTGTTLLLLPEDITKSYYEDVEGAYLDTKQPGWAFNCNAELPDFSFAVKNELFTIPGRYIKRGPVRGRKGKCKGAIQKSPREYPLFGCTALQVALVAFDIENVRIGWGHKKLV